MGRKGLKRPDGEGIISCLDTYLSIYSVEWAAKEGDWIKPQGKQEIGRVYGKARHILLGERTALNIISRCSGIALR